MSKIDRINQLLKFSNEDPSDPFNYYALALEYQKLDSPLAAKYYNLLLSEHPTYLATYYHAAGYFAGIGNPKKAGQIYQKGIELATLQHNNHAKKELENAYFNFQIEFE
ncbi:tetratricopeptide repeat protein [Pleomorphovibrio marinus]|uniref:tetratricopeptide repeat protein n=1 Tax=Pleomorphovibrio marinus TaxID=2164132 RepID=UPI000E09EE5E|nr:tetratricopeptide repeat protein [Pleomorphovibrio marinus]